MGQPNYYKYFFISIIVILIDQTVKMLVHFNMLLGSEINVIGDWFILHYVQNPGMAFGMEIGIANGKLLLTLFRLVAMIGIGYYLYILIKKGMNWGLLISIALILGGAVGNVIDSTFYGVILNNAPADPITPWFHGQVIDMLYFPLFDGIIPEWVPFWGGDNFLFFRPVFNIADSSIFIGVTMILVMQKRFFSEDKDKAKKEDSNLSDIEVESLDSDFKKV
jgi:signal peptidase II